MRAMLASPGDRVPTGPGWRHEVKWDGMRLLLTVDAAQEGSVRATARSGNDATRAFPEIQGLAGRVPAGSVLDCEAVVIAEGRPSFAGLANRMHVTDRARAARLAQAYPATVLAFDLLRLAGRDLVDEPWSTRRDLLEGLDLTGSGTDVPGTYDDGEMLFAATAQQGLEGIVSKRIDSRYQPGVRSRDWLKFTHRTRRSYVVGGWRPETGSSRVGGLLLGEPVAGASGEQVLAFRGRVGSGIAGARQRTLASALELVAADSSPFAAALPRLDGAGARWCEPVLVVEVEAASHGERLRHPTYLGIRADLSPSDLEGQS